MANNSKIMLDYMNSICNSRGTAVSLQDSLDEHQRDLEVKVRDSVAVNDAYGNILTASGKNDKVASFQSYGFDNSTLNWTLWLALYNDSWVFRRAIDKPAQDQVNCGFVIKGDKDYTEAYKVFENNKFDFIQLLSWGALFGGAVAVMMFEGLQDEDYGLPLNKAKCRDAEVRLYITDRWYGCAPDMSQMVENMRDPDYGKPKYYDITFADGRSVKVHHSYVLRYEHRTAPRFVKSGLLQGWGYAEGSHLLNELARDDQLKSSIASLVNKALIEVIKMDGMRGVFMGTDSGNMEQLTKRLEMVNWGRNYNSLTFLDSKDDYIPHELGSISGLSQLLEANMWQVAAALEMQGVLFGELKGGLSSETDASKRYAITIQNRCNSYYRPVLFKFLLTLFYLYDIEEVPQFEFNSLAMSELNKEKVENTRGFADLLNTLVQNEYISKYVAAKALKEYFTTGAININIDDEELDALYYQQQLKMIATYKKVKENRGELDMMQEQFPNKTNPFEGKLDYLNETHENNLEEAGLGGADLTEEPIGADLAEEPPAEE